MRDYSEISRKRTEKVSKKVYQYSLDGELIKIWSSTADCGRNGYNQGNVSSCCLGDIKQYKGFIWTYTPINPK